MARDPDRLGCAIESRQRDEPLTATASRVRAWLAVEQPGAWGAEALLDASRFDAQLGAELRGRSQRAGVRSILIRRKDRRQAGTDEDPERYVFAVRTDPTGRWIERLTVSDPADLLDLDLDRLHDAEPPGWGEPVDPDEGIVLLCTNGRHDPCCADQGRPTLRALHDAGVEVWESTHIGGDRFAANLVFLPSGVYLGRVEPDDGPGAVATVRDGRLPMAFYRGRCTYPPMVQAAEAWVRDEVDDDRIDAVNPVSARWGEDRAIVDVVHGEDRYRVELHRTLSDQALLTCTSGTSHAWVHHLDSLERVT